MLDINIRAEICGEYDVIVCGGGTAGCIAAIAAARCGVSVALIEASASLGGMMTDGNAGLTKFVLHGKDEKTQSKITGMLEETPEKVQLVGGIPMEITQELVEEGNAIGTAGTAGCYVYADRNEFKIKIFEKLNEAGVDVYLRSAICDVITENESITGVVTYTKLGWRAYRCKYIIDATGDGDIAALSGAQYVFGVGEDDAVYKQGLAPLGYTQIMGVMFRIGGVDFDKYVDYLKRNPEKYVVQKFGLMSFDEFIRAYENGEMVIFNTRLANGNMYQIYNYPRKGVLIFLGGIRPEGDGRNGLEVNDLTISEYEAMVGAREIVEDFKNTVPGFEDAFVMDTPYVGIRESRHIVGEYKLTVSDILTRREFYDGIGKGCHPVDIYPLPEEIKEIENYDEWYFNIPYRTLVCAGKSNLLMAGRCISATREASGCIRPTASCMVTGEAAGTAAALLVKDGISQAKDIDIEKLKALLKSNGVVL